VPPKRGFVTPIFVERHEGEQTCVSIKKKSVNFAGRQNGGFYEGSRMEKP
jgi:hypothetical protein